MVGIRLNDGSLVGWNLGVGLGFTVSLGCSDRYGEFETLELIQSVMWMVEMKVHLKVVLMDVK